MKKISIYSALFLFMSTIMHPIFAKEVRTEKSDILLQENFKQLALRTSDTNELDLLISARKPTENKGIFVIPKNWYLPSCEIPDDLITKKTNAGWRVQTKKSVGVFFPMIDTRATDFSLVLTVKSSNVPSIVAVSLLKSGMIHDGTKHFLQTVTIEPWNTKTVHIPVTFPFLSPDFYIYFNISGDVTFQGFTVRAKQIDLMEKEYTCLEGILEECSAIPDPKKSDYPDCRFVCRFKGYNITKGHPCPREISMVIDGFHNNKLLKTKNLKAGDKVQCTILPFEKLPEKMRTTQQADDLNLFQLENYYAVKIKKIKNFSESTVIPFQGSVKQYVSVFERKINPPVSKELNNIQQAAIVADLTRINTMLEGWDKKKIQKTNRAFQKAWEAEKAKDKPGYNRVTVNGQTYVWRNIDHSFWCLPEQYQLISQYQPMVKKNIEALIAFRDFLHVNGCQFIISIVPSLYDISSRVINPDFRDIPDFYTALTVQSLLKNGIETIYPSEEILKNFSRYPWTFFYPTNNHPSDTCQDVLSDLLAERLKRFRIKHNHIPFLFSTKSYSHAYGQDTPYLFPPNCDIDNNQTGTAYKCRRIQYNGKDIFSDPSSPILIIGNSYIQTPMLFPESLPTLLASKLSTGISFYRVDGYGPMLTIIQSFFLSPETFLKNKKVIILQIGVKYFYDSLRFSDIRKMDQFAKMLSGKTLLTLIPVEKNTLHDIDFSKNLYRASNIRIPAAGKYCIKDFEIKNLDLSKESILVIPICAKAICTAELTVNNKKIPIEECYQFYRYNKTCIRIPAGEKHIRVELKGIPGTEIAVTDFQIYQ